MELKPRPFSCHSRFLGLLIVPYGIETKLNDNIQNQQYPFNRTLWN